MIEYRRKPELIEAIKFTYPPSAELISFCQGKALNPSKNRRPGAVGFIELDTGPADLPFITYVREGSYIIKSIYGLFYYLDADVFEAAYEEVPQSQPCFHCGFNPCHCPGDA